jgi:hypothetical protein
MEKGGERGGLREVGFHYKRKSVDASPRLPIARHVCCAPPSFLSAQVPKSIVIGVVPVHAARNSNLSHENKYDKMLKGSVCSVHLDFLLRLLVYLL